MCSGESVFVVVGDGTWPSPCTHPLSVPQGGGSRYHLVVVEVVNQVLGDVKDAYTHIHRLVVDQTACVKLNRCEVIIKYISTSTGWTGYLKSKFVLSAMHHAFRG